MVYRLTKLGTVRILSCKCRRDLKVILKNKVFYYRNKSWMCPETMARERRLLEAETGKHSVFALYLSLLPSVTGLCFLPEDQFSWWKQPPSSHVIGLD
jgi:hypothetical protein